VTIEGKYQFEVEYPGVKRPASRSHSFKLPAGTTRVRLRSPAIFLDISRSVQGKAGSALTIAAPPLSAVNVYNSYNESCEILIDGRPVGYHPVTQELVSGSHDVSLRCASGRTPRPKRVDVPATQPGQATFTKSD
jgi:hypothetical protein